MSNGDVYDDTSLELRSVKSLKSVRDDEVYENEPTTWQNNEGYTKEDDDMDVEKSTAFRDDDIALEMPDDAIDSSDGCFARRVSTWQNAVSKFWRRYRFEAVGIVLSTLCVLYAAYFGYALYFEFGEEPSIRLLWVTALVIACMALSIISSCVRSNISRETVDDWKAVEYMKSHQKQINWSVLAFIYLFIVIFVTVDITYVTRNYYNLVSLSGIIVYVLLLFIFSFSPAKVNWRTVLWGIGLQFVFAMIVLRWPAGYAAFEWLGDRVTEFLAYSDAGAEFVFGESYMDHMFAFQVLPVVIYFSAVVSVLFYWGAMQFIIKKIAWIMEVTMETTAAESLNAAGNIFIGQTEAPLMIRPFMKDLTRSEIHAIMTGGFATIAGSVMAAYILFGVPANHLLSASVMSAPAALAISKLAYPETEKSRTTAKDVKGLKTTKEVNFIEAASNGASNAISLVANIAANLIAFIALLEFLNATLTWFGERVGIEELTFELICSYVLWPFALVMGVDIEDCRTVAQLIGTKTFLNEFVAYEQLGVLIDNQQQLDSHVAHNGSWYWQGDDIVLDEPGNNDTILVNGVISERSVVISTYALCGFSNIGSIGIQIGGLAAMAPERRTDIATVALRAMIAGSVACFMTACIAGLFFQPETS